MNIERTGNLSFYNERGILILNAKQFDTGRIFVFHIMDNDEPFDLSSCTAYLRIAKADGTQFQGHECCTVEGSKVIIKTNVGNGSQILTAAGTNVCELHLEDSDGISLTTWTFHIVVEPRVHDGSNMSSIDSYDVLDNMINMEKDRIASEEQRKENELQRKENEANRNTVFEEKIGETNAVITDCRLVIDTANQKISSFDAEINEIVDGITDEAQSYADNAKEAETNAANAASNAADSAATALQKAGDAATSAVLSQSYAVGGTQSRAGEDVDNAKYYSEKSQETLQKLQETTVTSIKGNAESAYRTGDVNITPENVGALSLKGGTVSGKVTVNNSFMVNKTSTTSPTGITELDIRNDGKVAINTVGGSSTSSLIHFNGGIGGTITNRASAIESYVKNIQQHNYDLRVSSRNAIIFDAREFKVVDDWGFGMSIEGADVYIGDISENPNESDNDPFGERLWIQTHSSSGKPQTRLYTSDLKIGREGNYFLEYYTPSTAPPRFKLRYGNKGSNFDCGSDSFTMWTNNDGVDILNENAPIQNTVGEVWLNKDDGTSFFNTDIILSCTDGVHKANLYLDTGNIFGQRGAGYNHAIKLGHNQDNVMRFHELGGRWEFYKGADNMAFLLDSNGIKNDIRYFETIVDTESDTGFVTRVTQNLSETTLSFYGKNATFIELGASDYPIGQIHIKTDGAINSGINIGEPNKRYSMSISPAEIYVYDSVDKMACTIAASYIISGSISPKSTRKYDLGDSALKWKNIYATNGTIQTSDRNEKNTIEELSAEKAQQLIYGLKPSTYKMNAGTSGRTHWGMISQDIEELFDEIGMTSLDFAGFIKSPKMHIEEEECDEKGKITKERVEEVIEGEYDYSLRYDEFIAPIIKVIQTQHEEIELQNKKIQTMEQRISLLEQQINLLGPKNEGGQAE